jgi:hypothetical protein
MHQLNVARNDLARAGMSREPSLRAHYVSLAESALQLWRHGYNAAPASTRRRWKCGR